MTSGARVVAVAGFRPDTVVSNEDIHALTGVEPDWVLQRTGIRTRRHATTEETVVTMAAAAGAKALSAAGVSPGDVDLVILATSTRTRPMPGGAPAVASLMGIPSPGAFDVNAVCSGFVYALSSAAAAVRLGQARRALVIGSDKVTDWITPADPDVYTLFADGAGAVVVAPADENGIGPAAWGSDGSRSEMLGVPEGSAHIAMDGPLVYRWAVRTVPKMARTACDLMGVDLADIDWLVPHQANQRIIDTVATSLGFPGDRIARDGTEAGNTSAASIPLALASLYEGGRVRPGELALLLGYGSGLTYAGNVIRL